jgi:hypothetical protein
LLASYGQAGEGLSTDNTNERMARAKKKLYGELWDKINIFFDYMCFRVYRAAKNAATWICEGFAKLVPWLSFSFRIFIDEIPCAIRSRPLNSPYAGNLKRLNYGCAMVENSINKGSRYK